jgi:hypothetical protein
MLPGVTTEVGFEWEAVNTALREVDAESGEIGEAGEAAKETVELDTGEEGTVEVAAAEEVVWGAVDEEEAGAEQTVEEYLVVRAKQSCTTCWIWAAVSGMRALHSSLECDCERARTSVVTCFAGEI